MAKIESGVVITRAQPVKRKLENEVVPSLNHKIIYYTLVEQKYINNMMHDQNVFILKCRTNMIVNGKRLSRRLHAD